MAQFKYTAEVPARRKVVSFMGHVFPTDGTAAHVFEPDVVKALRDQRNFSEVTQDLPPKPLKKKMKVLRRKG